jgi:exopolyphosphatase / guanosine-5'-triphosphate,3'-diphosphate pyrophosphatase
MIGVRQAVIDIGSNAIRLVVYAGAKRAPMPIYNEKSRAGLGACLSGSRTIDPATMEQAVAAIVRFHTLARAMDVETLRVVATAAVREATNGHELVARAAEMGIRVEIIDGVTEAYVAGLGILSEHSDSDGYVGDLGGGSLELARIANREIGARLSLPFGSLRIGGMVGQPPKDISNALKKAIAESGQADSFPVDRDLPFYLVGGSWRALARLHIHVSAFPLAVLSNYVMPPTAPVELLPMTQDRKFLSDNKVVPAARIDTLSGAAALLSGVVRLLKPSALVTSTSGLREGLLFEMLSASERQLDPFVEAARFEGARLARFRFHGAALADWTDSVFASQGPDMSRLRLIACLLADTAWNMTPEYRGDVALTLALDGSWPGATTEDRAILAAALVAVYDSKRNPLELLDQLASPEKTKQARSWGLAIRLAQRLDGGTGAALADSKLVAKDTVLELHVARIAERLQSESVARRLQRLGEAMGFATSRVVSGKV